MKIQSASISLPSTAVVTPRRIKKSDSHRWRHFLVAFLIAAGSLQAWVSLLQHVAPQAIDKTELHEHLSSLSPHLTWDNEGIDLLEVLTFLNKSAGVLGPSYEPAAPDSLYLLTKDPDQNGTEPKWEISFNAYWKHKVAFRRRELTFGLDYVESTIKRFAENKTAWPRILQALEEGGFPFLINWDSSLNCTNTCCDEQYVLDPSKQIRTDGHIPVMRLVAPPDCRFRLFIPTAPTLLYSSKDTSEWPKKLEENELKYPRTGHVHKVAWRGTDPTIATEMTKNKELFEVIPIVEKQEFELDEYQKYAAVLDVDTLQYPKLFCQNSVVLKTEPKCIDMFLSTLVPWEHYIPVKPDLSDLEEQAKFALAEENREQVTSIVANATEWCKENFLYEKLQDHLLTTLTFMLEKLDDQDPDWPGVWTKSRDEYLSGHFFMTRPNAWSLPKSTVGAIKTGFRRDDSRYNETSRMVDRRMLKEIMKWSDKKIAEEEEREMKKRLKEKK